MVDVKGAIAMVVRSLPDTASEEIERCLGAYADGDGYRLPGMCLNVLAT